MATSAPRPCTYPGCRELTQTGRCEAHVKQAQSFRDDRRGKTAERGYGGRWRKARESFLRSHPLCVECERSGLVAAATVVDHIIPHKNDKALFWDHSNWQPLCKPCHDSKTAREDGRWG